jgi:uncharacterized sporulation protein YeaH/YhbH (DUF444 family)
MSEMANGAGSNLLFDGSEWNFATLSRTYEALVAEGAPMAMKKVRHRRDIFPVFRELFQRRAPGEEARA